MKQKYYLLVITILISYISFANNGKDSLLLKSTETVKAHVSTPHNNVLNSATKQLLKEIKNTTNSNTINTSNIGGQFRSFPS